MSDLLIWFLLGMCLGMFILIVGFIIFAVGLYEGRTMKTRGVGENE